MIADRNIVCLASNWFYDPTSKHHVMRLLAERNHVVWVNYHGSRRPSASVADARAAVDKLGQFLRGPRRVAENITVLTPVVVPLPGSAAAQRINRGLLVRQIRAALRGLPRRPTQIWSFAPDVAFLRGRFDEELFLYYCVDDFKAFSGYDRAAIETAEDALVGCADAVITTSAALYDAKRIAHPHTALVPHGVDVEHFGRAAGAIPPADLDALPRPRLGFFGLIQDWVDVELLATVARRRREWSIVLIGDAKTSTAPLAGLTNVHLLGRRPYSALPACCAAFDLGLIPFRINELTRAVNPIKLREYLAAGLPVASTPLPEAGRYGPWVEIGEGPDGFLAACERGLAVRDAASCAARRAAMANESWRARVETLSEIVVECVRERTKTNAGIAGGRERSGPPVIRRATPIRSRSERDSSAPDSRPERASLP